MPAGNYIRTPEIKARNSIGTKRFHKQHPKFQKEINNCPKKIAKQRAKMVGVPKSGEHKQHLRGPRPAMSGKNNPKWGKGYEIIGSKNPNWKGGISRLPYPFNFNEKLKELTRERDGYICQLCGKTQEEESQRLAVHHIDYNKNNLSPKNLICLCKSCNSIANSNRKIWTKIFGRMVA